MDEENVIKYVLRVYWKSIFAILWPLVLLPLLFKGSEYPDQVYWRCLYAYFFIAGYWMTLCWPPAVTAFLPVVLLPCLTITGSNATSVNYLSTHCILAAVSSIYGLSIETAQIHRRWVLGLMKCFGCTPGGMHVGVVLCTFLLSMWIPNILVTRMVCSVVEEVLEEFQAQGIMAHKKDDNTLTNSSKSFYLGIAYAATIGGMTTYMGSATNILCRGLVFDGISKIMYPIQAELFVVWFEEAFPIAIVTIIVLCIWLQIIYLGLFRPQSEDANANSDKIRLILEDKIRATGPCTFQQWMIQLILLIGVILVFTRVPKIYDRHFVLHCKESMMLLIVVVLLIIFPKSLLVFKSCSANEADRPTKTEASLIPWGKFEKTILWDHVLIVGAGLAMSYGIRQSKLRAWLLETFTEYHIPSSHWFPHFFVACLVCSILTEITWNQCVAAIIIPILSIYAQAIERNPMLLCMGATLACSHAFCTSVGTPSNGYIKQMYGVRDMDFLKAGLMMKIVAMICLLVFDPFLTKSRCIFYHFWIISNTTMSTTIESL